MKQFLFFLFLLVIEPPISEAQNLLVSFVGGTSANYALSDIRKIDYSGAAMQLHFTNGTTLSCNISTIVNFRYTQSTGVDEPAFAATALAVSPNPAHELFTVSYQLTASGPVSLEIFDITGNLVYSEPQGEKASGYYTCKWKPTVNGIYLVKLRTARNTICKTILAQ